MATTALGTTLPTLLDIMKAKAPDGSIESHLVELMTQQNGLLKDAVWKQGNLETGERIGRRSAIPTPGFRLLNQGVAPQKSLRDQVDETCGLMEAMSKVDVKVAKMSGNAAAFRASEDMAFRQGFNNLFESTMWYGNTDTDPEKWMGFAPRFDTTGDTLYGGQMVASGVASSGDDSSSAWFIDWGLDSVYCIYPKNSNGGLNHEDLGVEAVQDEDGNEFRAYRTFFDWEAGLAVRDPRHVVRVFDIDTSAIVATDTLLITGLIKGHAQLERSGRAALYMNRFTQTFLHLQSMVNAANGTLTVANPAGEAPVVSFLGIPIRISDALTITESALA